MVVWLVHGGFGRRCCGCFQVFGSLSLSSVSSLSPGPLSGFFFSFSSVFFSIYRGRTGGGPWLVHLGAGFAGGWSATTRDSKAVFLLSAGGRPMPLVGGPTVWGLRVVLWRCRGEREREVFFLKKHSFSSVAGSGEGKKKGEQCRSKRHRSVFFFFFYV